MTSSSTPRAIATFYDMRFASIGLGGGVDGPQENDAYTAWASNNYGCDVLATVTPRGNENVVTVLYSAGCPFRWPDA
jgi:hypothetical protein